MRSPLDGIVPFISVAIVAIIAIDFVVWHHVYYQQLAIEREVFARIDANMKVAITNLNLIIGGYAVAAFWIVLQKVRIQ